MPAVHRWDLRNVTAFEFASQRMSRGDEMLRGIGKRFPDPYNARVIRWDQTVTRSEEHTSELQSRFDLVCRLLLEKKKKKIRIKRQENKNVKHNSQVLRIIEYSEILSI